jgi:arylsulfatase A-like enzyme
MEGYSTHLITNHALKFLDQMKKKDKPFFLYVAYNAPHFPYQGPGDEKLDVTAPGAWQKGSREVYAKMVEEMDKGIGQILSSIDASQLTENTLVVFKSDNGGAPFSNNGPLNNRKGTLWEGGIRVPCIARLPGKIAPNTESNQVGITMDWTATIAALGKVSPPEDRAFDGIDLLSTTAPQVRTLFWRRVDPKEVKTHRAVRHGDWKFIDTPDGKQFLYDLSKDIGEKTNLVAQNTELCSSLKHLIDTWESNISPPLYSQTGRQVP